MVGLISCDNLIHLLDYRIFIFELPDLSSKVNEETALWRDLFEIEQINWNKNFLMIIQKTAKILA